MTFRVNYPIPNAPLFVIYCDACCLINKETNELGLVWGVILADEHNNFLKQEIQSSIIPFEENYETKFTYEGKLRSIHLGLNLVKKYHRLSTINLRIFTQFFMGFYKRLSSRSRKFLRYDYELKTVNDRLWKDIIRDLHLVAAYELCTAYWTKEALELIKKLYTDVHRTSEKLINVPEKHIEHYYGFSIRRFYT